jgi:hypothetical protein
VTPSGHTASGTLSVATMRMCVRLARDRPPDDFDGRFDRRVFLTIRPTSDPFSPLERVAAAARVSRGLEVA